MKLSEAAQKAIELADTIEAYWNRERPKYHPHYPLIRANEKTVPAPPEAADLDRLLKSLSPEQIYTLILVLYIGRGDYPAHHLPESYQAMKETFEKPEYAISQMSGKRPLGEYLRDGLEELKKAGIDVDTLHLEEAVETSHS
jgi:hypothetical protein